MRAPGRTGAAALLVVAAVALAACGAEGSVTGSGATGTTSGLATGGAPTDSATPAQLDKAFFSALERAREERGDIPEVAACVADEVRKAATREELDEVEAGGTSLTLAQKGKSALTTCNAPTP